ncbi:hypothetical protein HK099_000356 [Clydaea vesicula]|uniref:Uncharacterized protein n=1 Tax=Clydaea vesicula TaxID=447962 RepID=A0AAD5XSS0_9FUNG|nr:hypothetical protein HK099_000356 [Clydaea vesicula]
MQTCGFEMLMGGNLSNGTYDFSNCRDWAAFINTLKKKGFFKNELEGSKEYKRLMTIAKTEFLKEKEPYLQLKDIITEYLSSFPLEEGYTPNDEPEDTEEWIYINEQELDAELSDLEKDFDFDMDLDDENNSDDDNSIDETREKLKQKKKLKGMMDLNNAVKGVKNFLNSNSGVEGVNYNSANENILSHFDDSNTLASESDSDDEDSDFNEDFDGTQFNADMFISTLKSLVGDQLGTDELGTEENLEDDEKTTEMDEYMNSMRRELSETKIRETFKSGEIEGELDLNINLAGNLLNSLEASGGEFGPVDTLLDTVGVNLKKY